MLREGQRRKTAIVYAATAAGFVLGLLILGLFYLCEKNPVEKAFHHVFVSERNADTSFSLPRRERPPLESIEEETLSEYDGYPKWFTEENIEFHSAVLIAGSRGYRNYRHQADLCHAFQILKSRGVPEDQIITFMFDDIAHHSDNPYPGQIFNRPGGENVYTGCAKDYTGWEVNRDTVLAVLRGDERAVAGKGSGRVLRRHPEQKVFLFYTDHGSVGNIAMPVGPPIYADELHAVLNSMAENDHFREMVIYLEACEGGSMFSDFDMDRNNKILAVTAANAFESSYATYCPDHGYQTRIMIPNATHINACMGDLFSVSWMEDTELVDVSEVFIEDQVNRVRYRTSNSEMYLYGSHVISYGDRDRSIAKQVIGNFMSYYSAPSGWTRSDVRRISERDSPNKLEMDLGVDQRQADLLYLYHKASNENADGEASRELEAELNRRRKVDMDIRALIQDLIDRGLLTGQASVEAYATKLIVSEDQLVKDWSCLREIVQAWETYCQPLDDYSRQFTRTFVNLCNVGVTSLNLLPSLTYVCPFPQ